MAIKDQTSLIRDLLDPDLDTPEIVRRHQAQPEDLRAAVRSQAFQSAAAAMREVDEARTAALLPVHTARALHRLARIAAQPAETTAQTESARRAATALIRAGRPAHRASPSGTSASVANGAGCPKDSEALGAPPAECCPGPPPERTTMADRHASGTPFRPPSAAAVRPSDHAAHSSHASTPGASLTVGDLLSVLAARDRQTAANPKPATAYELIARAGTG